MAKKVGIEVSALTTLNAAASAAAGSPPTKTEYDALVALVNQLRAVLVSAGLAK